jgi:hypothetical protein
MPDLAALFAGGRVIDLILAVIAAEFAIVAALATPKERRRTTVDLLFALAPGACLLLALKGALAGAPWTVLAAWLALSFPIQIVDLIRRHGRRGRR